MSDPAAYIGQFIKLRNYVKQKTDEFEAQMEPYREGMKAIENQMGALLNEMPEGKASIATANGTVFRKKELAVTIADREAWFDFIAADFENNKKFLTTAVTKTEVQEFIDTQNALPPGLNATFIYKTQFRSPNSKD